MDCIPPGYFVHGILQARILEWVAMPSSRGSSPFRNWTWSPGLLGQSVQSLSHVRLFATPWTAAHQASLSIINSQSLFKLTSIESVMPSGHLILCRPLLLWRQILLSLAPPGKPTLSTRDPEQYSEIVLYMSKSRLPIFPWFFYTLSSLLRLLKQSPHSGSQWMTLFLAALRKLTLSEENIYEIPAQHSSTFLHIRP